MVNPLLQSDILTEYFVHLLVDFEVMMVKLPFDKLLSFFLRLMIDLIVKL